jgi:hypothetical protein
MNRRELVVQVSDEQIGCGLSPANPGDFVALYQAQQVLPGHQVTWYYWGPSGANVHVSLQRVNNSGGHFHGGGPIGAVAPTSFRLGSNYPQNVPVVFTAPPAAGTVQQIAQFSPGGTVILTNNVAVPSLVALTAGVGITLTGSSATHPQNHFGLPALISKIQQLGMRFHQKYNKNIFVNDMSLPQGGLYDFRNSWAPPHATHREGRTVDINSTTMSNPEKQFFRQTAVNLGFQVTLETNPEHWHLSI